MIKKIIVICLFTLIPTVTVAAGAAADDGDKKKEEQVDPSKPYEIKGIVPEPSIDPVIQKMTRKIILYDKRQTFLKEKAKKEKEEAKKKAEVLEEAKKTPGYIPKKPNIYPKDILNAFKEIGVPSSNIKLEGRDLHDYAIRLVCDGEEKISDLTENQDSSDIDLDRLSLRIVDICNIENRYREW